MRDGFNEQIRLQFGRVTLRTRAARAGSQDGLIAPLIFLRDAMNPRPQSLSTVEKIRLVALYIGGAMAADPK
jgi:hypothetical protein